MKTENALQIIDAARNRGALTFVGQGVREVVPLYKLEATEIEVKRENFHDLDGKLVLKKEFCDKIADASGISFMAASVESIRAPEEPALGLPARTIFRGTAQGKTRLPDGTWRESSPETYDFDYVAKAKAESGGDAGKERRKAQEYYKAGPMRASTGARLRVIRQLTGMPTAFAGADIGATKTFVFSRIVQNTDYILSTHEGKMMAIAMATGAANLIYGQKPEAQGAAAPAHEEEPPMRDANPGAEEAEGGAPAPSSDPFNDFSLESEGAPSSRQATIIAALMDWTASGSLAPETSKAIQGLVDRGESNLRTLEPTLALVKLLGEKKLSKAAVDAVRADLDRGVTDPIILDALLVKANANASELAKRIGSKAGAA